MFLKKKISLPYERITNKIHKIQDYFTVKSIMVNKYILINMLAFFIFSKMIIDF